MQPPATPMPPEATSDNLLDKLKIWGFPLLLGALNVLLTQRIGDYTTKIEAAQKDITELTTTVKLETAQREYLTQRVSGLEAARGEAGALHKEMEKRLNSLEQRAAIYDQYMETHK